MSSAAQEISLQAIAPPRLSARHRLLWLVFRGFARPKGFTGSDEFLRELWCLDSLREVQRVLNVWGRAGLITCIYKAGTGQRVIKIRKDIG